MLEMQALDKNVTIESRIVAEMIGKEHKNLIRDIRGYYEHIEKIGAELKVEPSDFFVESSYISEQNKRLPCYLLTKKGCEFVANKLTGAKGAAFTAAYVDRFNKMEQFINYPQMPQGPTIEYLKAQLAVIESIDSRVGYLENNMVIDYGQERNLAKLVNSTVCNILGGKKSNAYKDKSIRAKVYSRLNHDYFDYFNINARGNTPNVKYQEACEYVQEWQPDNNLRYEIADANNI